MAYQVRETMEVVVTIMAAVAVAAQEALEPPILKLHLQSSPVPAVADHHQVSRELQ
jgi:hypothetical protein